MNCLRNSMLQKNLLYRPNLNGTDAFYRKYQYPLYVNSPRIRSIPIRCVDYLVKVEPKLHLFCKYLNFKAVFTRSWMRNCWQFYKNMINTTLMS